MVLRLFLILLLSFFSFPAYATDWVNDASCEAAYLFESDHSPGTVITDSGPDSLNGAAEAATQPTHATASPPDPYSSGYVSFTDDFVKVTSEVFDQSQLTVVVWFNYTGQVADADRIFIFRTAGKGFQIVRDSTADYHGFLFHDASSDQLQFPPDIDDLDNGLGGWFHLAMVVDRDATGTARLVGYIDGVSQTVSGRSDSFNGAGTDGILTLTQDGDGTNSLDGADMDEFGFFSSLLDGTDVNDIMDNGLSQGGASVVDLIINGTFVADQFYFN